MSASNSGTGHYLEMTISSVVLIVLMPIFIGIVGPMIGEDFEAVTAYFAKPVPAIVTALTLIITLLHFKSGVTTLIEDYVSSSSRKVWFTFTAVVSYLSIAIVIFTFIRIAL